MGRPKLWTGPCAVDDCTTSARSRGWCQKHYYRWLNNGDPLVVRQKGKVRVDVFDRTMARVNKSGPVSPIRPDLGPCWIWTGCLNRQGYGQVNVGLREGRALVHRVVFTRIVGRIDAGLDLDHLCRTPACCNPKHLEPVTHQENIARGEFGATLRRKFASMTHCRNGHERSGDNIRMTKEGRRRCRACCREWARGAALKKRVAA